MEKPAIYIQKLAKYFDGPKGRTQILQDICLTEEPGEFITVVGRSG